MQFQHKKIRILHIIPSLGPLRGGPSVSVPAMCRGLAEAGLQITLVTTDDNGPERLNVPLGKPVDTDGYERLYFRRQTGPYTVSLPLLSWLEQTAGSFDLVHIHAVFSHVSDWAPHVLRRHRRPYGITPRGILCDWGMYRRRPLAKRLFYNFLVGPNLQRAAFVHFTSNQEQQVALPWGNLPQAKVIPLGFPLEIRPRIYGDTITNGKFRLLFLSRVDPIKGLELIFEAVVQIQQEMDFVCLTVAGDGKPDYMNKMKQLATKLGIAPKVEWVGFVNSQEKQTVLQQADVFVLPSYYESFGVASVEAMAAGLPIIISDQVGISPEVKQANAGVVIPCEVGALVSALKYLASQSALRRNMGAIGQTLARERFSLEAMTRNLIEMYEEVLRQPKKPIIR